MFGFVEFFITLNCRAVPNLYYSVGHLVPAKVVSSVHGVVVFRLCMPCNSASTVLGTHLFVFAYIMLQSAG